MIYTLLEMTQQILSSMDSDEVNSIGDTVESYQVAQLLRQVYYDIASDIKLPSNETLFELESSGNSDQPCLMFLPSNVIKVHSIKYDNKLDTDTYKKYIDVDFVDFPVFLERQTSLVENTSDVGQQSFTNNGETFEVMYRTDRFPTYYTSTDNYTLLFDSYNSTVDSTLQKSKTMCQGIVYPLFLLEDEYIPELDPTGFSYLINKAKVRAFVELKQAANPEASAEARRQKILTQVNKRTVEDIPALDRIPRFGRRGSTSLVTKIPKTLRSGS
jgi:hypothetical protein